MGSLLAAQCRETLGGGGMSSEKASLQDLVIQLQAEDLVSADSNTIERALGHMADVQPWYVRTMVGFGAWLASLLLIGFVASIGFTLEGGFSIFGLGFMAGAVLLRRTSESDFMIQSALAASLAGQALLIVGVMETVNWDEPEVIFTLLIFLNVVLFVIFPDRIHRVLSVLISIGSVTVLFYIWEWNVLVPLLGPAVAMTLILLSRNWTKLLADGKGIFLRPLQSGLMLSAFGCLMLSTVYILPELGGSFEFYPRPWISTVLLGVLLLFVARDAWAGILTGASQITIAVIYALLVVFIGCAWMAPGLILALIVTLLGANSGHRTMAGAGIGFLVVFLGAYFYGIQITMLQKSATLVASGIAILVARWLVLKLLSGIDQEEASHV
jgi:uncharacterized membrane protein